MKTYTSFIVLKALNWQILDLAVNHIYYRRFAV